MLCINRLIFIDDDIFSLKQSNTNDNESKLSRQKSLSRNRTSSATDSNQPISKFESLSINTQLPNHKTSDDTSSPTLRARRFSEEITHPPLETVEPSLFSPGSVRARTVYSTSRQNSVSNPPTEPPTPPPTTSVLPPPPKRLDIRLTSGKTVNTSDFIHANHLVNPHIEMSHEQQQQNQYSNETARTKLLQSVYVNNSNTNPTSSLSDSLTNGTNSHTHTAESASNCTLS